MVHPDATEERREVGTYVNHQKFTIEDHAGSKPSQIYRKVQLSLKNHKISPVQFERNHVIHGQEEIA